MQCYKFTTNLLVTNSRLKCVIEYMYLFALLDEKSSSRIVSMAQHYSDMDVTLCSGRRELSQVDSTTWAQCLTVCHLHGSIF